MKHNYTVQPVDFKLGEYMGKSINFYKDNFIRIFLGFLCLLVMCIFPFFALLGVGNFYKFCARIRNGEGARFSEIFSFDDFVPCFKLFLIIFALSFVFILPVSLFNLPVAQRDFSKSASEISFVSIIFYLVFIYLGVKAYYMIMAIALLRVRSIRKAWNLSVNMTKNHFFIIFVALLVANLLSYLGILLCFVGVIITLPFNYVFNYIAYEDALRQISTSEEIKEIYCVQE
ncbi:MAG: hypothetical protein FDW93_04560 [Bergeyella sp.]|nr:hypothetical protein [Bergeyella sp.]